MVAASKQCANALRSLCSRLGPITMPRHRMRPDLEHVARNEDHLVAQVDITSPVTPARRTLSDDVHLLAGLLGEVLRESGGERAFAHTETARTLAKNLRGGEARAGSELDALVRGLSDGEAETLVRAFTNYFQLINLAEDSERIRRVRDREAAGGGPRRGSLREAVGLLAAHGVTAEQLAELLEAAQIRLVFTAHPT